MHNRNLKVIPADSWHQPDNIENEYPSAKEKSKSDKIEPNEQCNEEYIENDITEIRIQTLNDDCLTHIFLQLPIVDRIRIERGKHIYSFSLCNMNVVLKYVQRFKFLSQLFI